jgi:hypothetical protein
MECEFCGEEITPGALACPRCGSPAPKQVAPPDNNAPAQVPGQAATPQPTAPPVGEKPPDPPLAKLEEDFIALAEETVAFDDASAPGPEAPPNGPADAGVVPGGMAAITDATVLPGAYLPAEQVAIDGTLVGGYKGPEATSVAGAGEQTADDPFGLNITEKVPPVAKEWKPLRAASWRYRPWWNITVLIVGIALLVSGVGIGVYFGFVKKSGPDMGAPVSALKDYMVAAVSGDQEAVNRFAAPGNTLKTSLDTILRGYEKYGIVTVKGFGGKTLKINGTNATVAIDKLEVEITNEKGDKEVISILDIRQPFKLPTTIQLIQQNGDWKVKT